MHADDGSPVPFKKCSYILYSLQYCLELFRVRHLSKAQVTFESPWVGFALRDASG